MNLFIFNPDNEFAHVNGVDFFKTPKKNVIEMRKKYSFLFALMCEKDDAIFFIDGKPAESDIPSFLKDYFYRRNIRFYDLSNINNLINEEKEINLHPWGWNKSIIEYFKNISDKIILTSEPRVDSIKLLAHRRTTIEFLKHFSGVSEIWNMHFPIEVDSPDLAKRFISSGKDVYFKAPWSSSGRGVQRSKDMPDDKLTEWVFSVIKKQGSVMIEKSIDKIFEFASEWNCENGEARFLGFSIYKTSNRNIYKGNLIATKKEIDQRIKDITDANLSHLINTQKMIIETLISNKYNGPLGIDIIVDKNKRIMPCLEINLRYTMGHIALMLEEKKLPIEVKEWAKKLISFES